MAYKALYRKLCNGIQNTAQKNKQWHTKQLHRKISNGIQNTAQKTKY